MALNLRQFVRNVASQWLGIVLQAVVAFAVTPYQIRRLGEEGNGVLMVINSYVGYSGLLNLGLGSAIVKYIAEHNAREEWDELNETASTIFTIYLAIGAFCLLAGLALAVPLPHLARLPPELASQGQLLLCLMSVALFFQFPGSVYSGALMGLQRFDLINTYVLVLLVARTVGVVLVLKYHPSLVLVGAINMASFILDQVAAYLWSRRLLPQLRCSPSLFRRARVRKVFGFSSQAFLFQVAERLINATDSLVITQAKGPGPVTHYQNGLTLVDKARELLEKAAIVLMPGVSDAAARKDTRTLRSLWRSGNKASLMLAMPVALVLIVWGRHVVTLWLDQDLASKAYESLAWLAAAFVMQTLGRGVAKPLFEGWGKISLPARVTIVEGAANLILSVVLVRTWGIAGVAFATFLPAAVSGLLVLPYLACRELQVSFLAHLFHTFVRALPPLVPAYGVLWYAERLGLHQHLWGLAVTCPLVLLVYVLGGLVVTFQRDERAALMAPILRRLGRA
ncbi:MAG: polysaccharide biosynthesis protein [Deltaproteobacteria bacterium]|nr:polysaccharide biosynthesis protein [Deltaproteobacteria bacterium]